MKLIYLAGGCFWGTEKYLASIPGVIATEVGYANGKTDNPTYEDVCSGNTDHVEVVRVEFDPAIISLSFLLEVFYKSIDPLAVNRQGGDVGRQYRTGIYYIDEGDHPIIESSLEALQKDYERPIAIEHMTLKNYSPAEEYHQKYLDKNPAGYCHIPSYMFKKAAKARDKSLS